MADILIKAKSNKPGASEITLVNGEAIQSYRLAEPGPDWGNAVWESSFSGPRGTQGARSAGGTPQNRPIVIPLQLRGSSQDNLQALYATLASLTEDMRRFGGVITWRPQGGTYLQHFDVFDAGARPRAFDRLFHEHNRLTVELGAVCAPYLRGDPYDIFDDFLTDTAVDYTKDANAAGLAVSGGVLVPATTGTSRWRHTARGYQYGDQEATLKFTTGSTVASYSLDVFGAADVSGVETFLSARLTGGNLLVVNWTAGTPATLSSTAFALSTSTTYWLRFHREGRIVAASVYTSEPTPLATPAATLKTGLSAFDNLSRAKGHSGFRVAVVATGERYDDFRVEPYTYSAGSVVLPDERALRPAPPGDASSLADLVVTNSGTPIPVWALFGSWPRPAVWNQCWNGDFEDDVDGWSVAAVSGVTGAATSITRNTTAARNKYGGANGQIVCPATANTGATFRINRRFNQGQTYVLLLWASSAAGVTNVRARLGVSGDIASSATNALTTTPSLLAVSWTPTVNRDGAYIAAEITAATGTTWNIDGVCVFEGRMMDLFNGLSGSDTSDTVTGIPDDLPATPFMIIFRPEAGGVGQPYEIGRVETVDPVTRTLTFTRALEGTTGLVHAASSTFAPVPEIRSHFEGKGAQPPVGVIEAESCDTGNLFTWAIAADASQRLDNVLSATGLGASGSVSADYLVDPHLLVPDDYTQGELRVEVWARVSVHAGLTGTTAILAAAPETATFASGIMSSNFGAIRLSEEYGKAGKVLIEPSSGAAYRMARLGTVTFAVDRKQPLRSRLQVRITWTAATAATLLLDYLILVPSNSRSLSPSGIAAGPTLDQTAAEYPAFIVSSAETTKRVRSDLSGLTGKPPFPLHPHHGLGGSLLELPPGPADWFLKLSNLVADDPTSDTTAETAESSAAHVHLAITPRFRLARSS